MWLTELADAQIVTFGERHRSRLELRSRAQRLDAANREALSTAVAIELRATCLEASLISCHASYSPYWSEQTSSHAVLRQGQTSRRPWRTWTTLLTANEKASQHWTQSTGAIAP